MVEAFFWLAAIAGGLFFFALVIIGDGLRRIADALARLADAHEDKDGGSPREDE